MRGLSLRRRQVGKSGPDPGLHQPLAAYPADRIAPALVPAGRRD
jgi:hypothetical protein